MGRLKASGVPMADSIRRAQLITPFGVGALTVLKNGSAVITAGLDAWFQGDDVEREEFEIKELRLTSSLGVKALYTPPDFRGSWAHYGKAERRNIELTVPFLLLPRWHFCPKCRRMVLLPLHHDATGRGRPCEHHPELPLRRRPRVQQVRFLVMCQRGHVDDFPWREWVHSAIQSTCTGTLQLRVLAGASLTAVWVSCEACDARRNLGGIMNARPDGTTDLSRLLQSRQRFGCRGHQPWLGGTDEGCTADIRATLRSATNLHFARLRTAIFLPPEAVVGAAAERLVDAIEHRREVDPDFRFVDDTLRQTGASEARARNVKGVLEANGEAGWKSEQIDSALAAVDRRHLQSAGQGTSPRADARFSESAFRHEEFDVLTRDTETDELLIRSFPASRYVEPVQMRAVSDLLERVSLVHKLRETRAYFGFTRVRPDESGSVMDARRALSRQSESWLTATVVRGEGIFLQLRDDAVAAWERTIDEADHLARMRSAFLLLRRDRRVPDDLEFSPRLVLLHTLAHVLINRLVFDCGYSSASLRERIYASTREGQRMAGLLLYTAAGDSEGTMGGLVEMGRPGRFERVLRRAIEAAQWCSLDPVCMEVGQAQGQGPDSCNLAACHSCALVPETSCELFNRFLDRTLLVGTMQKPELGLFTRGSFAMSAETDGVLI